LDLIAKNFPDAETVVLLIRPFGTKPSIAGFYFKEDGRFQDGPPLLEFPFRRKDLAPDDTTPPPERARREIDFASRTQKEPVEPAPDVRPSSREADREPAPLAAPPEPAARPEKAAEPELAVFAVPKTKSRLWNSAIWLPLSAALLLVGVVLGFQVAFTIGPRPWNRSDPYRLALTASPAGNDIEVKWDCLSPVIKKAQRGILTIEDGAYRKPIQLDSDRLHSGTTVLYRHYSNQVRFRLEVFLKDSSSVVETLEWKH
jgi:hypothetical protein